VSELRRGKLGIYSASMENFVFERIGTLAEGNVGFLGLLCAELIFHDGTEGLYSRRSGDDL